MKITIFLAMFFCITSAFAVNDTIRQRVYNTNRYEGVSPKIDGKADDAAWNAVEWQGDFVQYEPYEGKAPTQETEFKVLYDNDFVYVLIKSFETQIDSIDTRLTRRDGMEGDMVSVQFDSYNDKMTAFSFFANAGGVKSDAIVINDLGNEDATWDPIWYVKTAVEKDAWISEMKIPLSQLRFNNSENQIWGIQIGRYIQRKKEWSIWQFIPRDASVWVLHFGELNGIRGVKPKRQFELTPYSVASIQRFEKEEGNPYLTGKKSNISAGLDGKIGITNDFTLDFTINPDFGQVEADPSEVNLTAFETYLDERRPFFVAGRNVLSFGLVPGDSDFSRANLFYTRRIGRRPQYEPELNDGEYADMPENTSILGALKVTGKNKKGWSLGVLESVGAEEKAEINISGDTHNEVVEPLTNYFVGSVKKDINKGKTQIGASMTATNRFINDDYLKHLHTGAYTAGVDFIHYFKERTYYLNVKGIFSHVEGDSTALINTQRSPLRYYQRPDASYVKYDSTRTSLNGHGGVIMFSKSGDGHIRFATWITWTSPGFDNNDIGYISRGDNIFQVFWMQYRIWEPFSIFRNISVNFNQWSGWDFGGNNNFSGTNMNFNVDFKNYWELGGGFNHDFKDLSNSTLRGGPAMRGDPGNNIWLNIETDDRKKFSAEYVFMMYKTVTNSVSMNRQILELSYRPLDVLNISFTPSLDVQQYDLQYVTDVEFNGNSRYIMGGIDRTTLSASFRLNLSITPDLTLQYYGQPFISAGKYDAYKYITDSKADEFENRFQLYSENHISYDSENEIFNVDENLDNIIDYNFELPDYNAYFFISNLVARWEYMPGSVLYLVWSQNRSDGGNSGVFDFSNDMNTLGGIHAHNTFLIKLSYRIPL